MAKLGMITAVPKRIGNKVPYSGRLASALPIATGTATALIGVGVIAFLWFYVVPMVM